MYRLNSKIHCQNVKAIGQAPFHYGTARKRLALDVLTNYSVSTANKTVDRWRELGHFLLVKLQRWQYHERKDGYLFVPKRQAEYPDQQLPR
jgi:hypothetical protein